jgi:hypothetical protein
MAAGFYAKTFNAKCLTNVPFCDTFSSLSAYLCYGYNETTAPMGGLQSVGCPDTQYLQTGPFEPQVYGLEAITYGYTPTNLYVYPEWEANGRYGPLLSLPSNYFFNLEELNAKVGTKTLSVGIFGGVDYTRTYHGFRYANPICLIPLRKKYSQYKPYFKNFSGVNWTNWVSSEAESNEGDTAFGYVGEDPLGNIYNDGGEYSTPMLYTRGVEQPFLGENFYEDTQSNINKSLQNYRVNFLPFCDPIKIYDASGKQTGYADGIGFQVFVFRSTVKNRFLPLYYYTKGPNPQFKYLDTHLQYFTIELWSYLSCYGINNNIIKSPRIFTYRWFAWSQNYDTSPYDFPAPAPCNPYFYLKCNMQEAWYMKFNLLQNNQGLQNKIFYTPFNRTRLFLGA